MTETDSMLSKTNKSGPSMSLTESAKLMATGATMLGDLWQHLDQPETAIAEPYVTILMALGDAVYNAAEYVLGNCSGWDDEDVLEMGRKHIPLPFSSALENNDMLTVWNFIDGYFWGTYMGGAEPEFIMRHAEQAWGVFSLAAQITHCMRDAEEFKHARASAQQISDVDK